MLPPNSAAVPLGVSGGAPADAEGWFSAAAKAFSGGPEIVFPVAPSPLDIIWAAFRSCICSNKFGKPELAVVNLERYNSFHDQQKKCN